MSTSTINDEIQKKHPYLFRNNRGSVKINGRFLRFGIPLPTAGRKEKDKDLKGSDWIGFTQIKITKEMVGKTLPIFTAIEVKSYKDVIKKRQIRFLKSFQSSLA